MDVEADLERGTEARGVLEGPVGERERGVQAEERPQVGAAVGLAAADEVDVLGQPRLGHLGAVAVGDLIAEAGAQARLAHGARDRV